jgi:putative ATP-dependent endonuclease of OLD family
VLVPIEGVDFAPYVEVLLRPSGGSTIADRVVVVTDADPKVPGNRKADLEAQAAGWGSAAKLSVFINKVTLEHELFGTGNEALLKAAFLALYPQSEAYWAEKVDAVQPDDRATAFVDLLKAKQTRKGDFAQRIADLIDAGEAFNVPAYLDQAIRKIAEQ